MWGKGYKERNEFQEYFLEIIALAEQEDKEGIQQLMDELTPEQQNDIYGKLASYTRSKIKDLHVSFKAL